MKFLTWEETRVFSQAGQYLRTTLSVLFEPFDDLNLPPIAFTFRNKTDTDSDPELLEFRGRVAEVIARELLASLREENYVEWSEQIAFETDGIVFGPKELFCSYKDIGPFEFKDGQLRLQRLNEKSPFFLLSTHAVNFFPGFFLLFQIIKNGGKIPT